MKKHFRNGLIEKMAMAIVIILFAGCLPSKMDIQVKRTLKKEDVFQRIKHPELFNDEIVHMHHPGMDPENLIPQKFMPNLDASAKQNPSSINLTSINPAQGIDLTAFDTSIRDQGQFGSCTAFATVAVMENQRKQQKLSELDISEHDLWRRYQYSNFEPTFLGAMESFLVVEADYPYNSQPTVDLSGRGRAKIFGRVSYLGGNAFSEVRRVLQEGRAVVTGVPVAEFFMNPRKGVIVVPENKDGLPTKEFISQGGHALAVVGIEFDAENPEKGFFVVKNSWTTAWGDNGYGYVPFEYCSSVYNDMGGIIPCIFFDFKTDFNDHRAMASLPEKSTEFNVSADSFFVQNWENYTGQLSASISLPQDVSMWNGIKIQQKNGALAPLNCTDGKTIYQHNPLNKFDELIYTGKEYFYWEPIEQAFDSGIRNGALQSYLLCVKDLAGNYQPQLNVLGIKPFLADENFIPHISLSAETASDDASKLHVTLQFPQNTYDFQKLVLYSATASYYEEKMFEIQEGDKTLCQENIEKGVKQLLLLDTTAKLKNQTLTIETPAKPTYFYYCSYGRNGFAGYVNDSISFNIPEDQLSFNVFKRSDISGKLDFYFETTPDLRVAKQLDLFYKEGSEAPLCGQGKNIYSRAIEILYDTKYPQPITMDIPFGKQSFTLCHTTRQGAVYSVSRTINHFEVANNKFVVTADYKTDDHYGLQYGPEQLHFNIDLTASLKGAFQSLALYRFTDGDKQIRCENGIKILEIPNNVTTKVEFPLEIWREVPDGTYIILGCFTFTDGSETSYQVRNVSIGDAFFKQFEVVPGTKQVTVSAKVQYPKDMEPTDEESWFELKWYPTKETPDCEKGTLGAKILASEAMKGKNIVVNLAPGTINLVICRFDKGTTAEGVPITFVANQTEIWDVVVEDAKKAQAWQATILPFMSDRPLEASACSGEKNPIIVSRCVKYSQETPTTCLQFENTCWQLK